MIGWLAETCFVYLNTNKWVDRGFLIGPYCPIYGVGAVAMILYLTQYKENILTVFILGVVICSILEYLTSYFMELFFKTRWWDYSNHKFNLNGRICGKNCLLFGVGGLAVIYLIHPLVNNFLSKFSNRLFFIISIVALVIFILDLVISLNVVNKFKKTLTNLDLKKDSTQEFSKIVKETIKNNHKVLQSRLIKAFPNINFNKLIDIKDEIKDELIELKEKILKDD